MKAGKSLILGLVILSSTLIFAQPKNEEKIETLINNCTAALEHNNLGVAESAIYVSIQFKSRFPQANDKKFIAALNNLAENSESPRISYKAQLARIYFNNQDWFSGIEIKPITSETEVYEEIAEKVNSIMFAGDF